MSLYLLVDHLSSLYVRLHVSVHRLQVQPSCLSVYWPVSLCLSIRMFSCSVSPSACGLQVPPLCFFVFQIACWEFLDLTYICRTPVQPFCLSICLCFTGSASSCRCIWQSPDEQF
jgi:hypothetical protein